MTVRLAAARPVLIELAAPDSLKRKARTLKLRVASTLPAKLKVGGTGGRAQSFAVGHRTRQIAVRISPGSKDLDLRLQLKAGKRTSTRTLSVERG